MRIETLTQIHCCGIVDEGVPSECLHYGGGIHPIPRPANQHPTWLLNQNAWSRTHLCQTVQRAPYFKRKCSPPTSLLRACLNRPHQSWRNSVRLYGDYTVWSNCTAWFVLHLPSAKASLAPQYSWQRGGKRVSNSVSVSMSVVVTINIISDDIWWYLVISDDIW